jgi:hypothetical protein
MSGDPQRQIVEAKIYDQDGNLRPFRMKDTFFNRLFREWLAVHDRYSGERSNV